MHTVFDVISNTMEKKTNTLRFNISFDDLNHHTTVSLICMYLYVLTFIYQIMTSLLIAATSVDFTALV